MKYFDVKQIYYSSIIQSQYDQNHQIYEDKRIDFN